MMKQDPPDEALATAMMQPFVVRVLPTKGWESTLCLLGPGDGWHSHSSCYGQTVQHQTPRIHHDGRLMAFFLVWSCASVFCYFPMRICI